MHDIACVSFLNSKPLIDPVVTNPGVHVRFAVPAELLPLIEDGSVSAALLPMVDFQNARTDLLLLPAGMIGCDGPTLTVRLYSRVPPAQIHTLHGDTDSHTSVILARLILRERFGVAAPLVPLAAREGVHPAAGPETMLLIGDKVVNASPDPAAYPHQLDLGEEWKRLTGLPFVFAMWMIRKDRVAAEGAAIAHILDDARRRGTAHLDPLLDRYAAEKGWPRDLARRYFTEYLRYEVTPAARQGLGRFFDLAERHGLLARGRAVEFFELPG
jgi:chorismate dehydratase